MIPSVLAEFGRLGEGSDANCPNTPFEEGDAKRTYSKAGLFPSGRTRQYSVGQYSVGQYGETRASFRAVIPPVPLYLPLMVGLPCSLTLF